MRVIKFSLAHNIITRDATSRLSIMSKLYTKKTQGKYRDVRCTKRQIIEIKLLLFFSILSDRRILLAAAMPVTMINDCSNILLKRIYLLVMHDGLRLYPHIYDALK